VLANKRRTLPLLCVTLTFPACAGGHTPAPTDSTHTGSQVASAALGSTLHAATGAASGARAGGIDGVIAGARQIYANETSGQRAHADLQFIASDPILLQELDRGDYAAAQAEARLQMLNHAVRHITRVSVIRAGQVLVNAVWNSNGLFVVAPVQEALRVHGRDLGTLLVSTQDVVGYVKLVHRYTGAEVVVRGASGQLRTSLPPAAHTSLPAAGSVSIAGVEYVLGAFQLTGWGGEPLSAWVLDVA
jgi:hypothetical protein